ncbi:hypothetical protein ACCE85_002611 [Photobacterium damselae]
MDGNGNDKYKKAASPIELAAFPNVWWSWREFNPLALQVVDFIGLGCLCLSMKSN